MRGVLGLIARAIPVVLVVAGALTAFEMGVELSERAGIPEAPVLVRLYYAAGLFVLGGLDLGVPTGGPEWARNLLWAVYFGAPVITTTAVVEGVLRLARPRWLIRLLTRDHTIVVGDGNVAHVYAAMVRKSGHRLRIVDVGALRRPADRYVLALHRARAVVLASRNDLENLDLAWEIARAHPQVRVACHVAELGLRRSADAVAQSAGVRMFNSHETAAARLYASTLAPHFAATEGEDGIALIGFGRFGQTVLRHIEENATGEVNRIVLIDRDADRLLRMFREHLPADPSIDCSTVDGDIRDPALWDRVGATLQSHTHPVVVLCTDDEAINLQAAIGLRERLPNALLYVRHFPESAFVVELTERYDLECVAIEGVMAGALAEHYAALTR